MEQISIDSGYKPPYWDTRTSLLANKCDLSATHKRDAQYCFGQCFSFFQYSTFQYCYELPVIYHTIINYTKLVKMTSKRQFQHQEF